MIRKSFQPQFEPLILAGTKIHTIRPTPKRLPQIGEEFVGFVWTGKPYRSPQREFFQSTVTEVKTFEIAGDCWTWINDRRLKTLSSADAFAVNDGFTNYAALLDWFRANHGLPFVGCLIQWQVPVISPQSSVFSLQVSPLQ